MHLLDINFINYLLRKFYILSKLSNRLGGSSNNIFEVVHMEINPI